MDNHKGKRLFITGIPTSGKSYLAKSLNEQTSAIIVHFDKVLDEHMKDPRYEKWINFYWDQDEKTYLTQTSPEEQRRNLILQAECFWPLFAEHIRSYRNETRPVIFDSVSLFPSIVRREFGFPGVVLASPSVEEISIRNQRDPRWSTLPELQRLEADVFFNIEQPLYLEEAKRFDVPIFEKADEAIDYCANLLK